MLLRNFCFCFPYCNAIHQTVQCFSLSVLCLTLLTARVAPVCLQEAESLVSAVLPADKQAAAAEIALYLKEAVGNATRIDYGTGIGFLAWFFFFSLYCRTLLTSAACVLMQVIPARLSRHKTNPDLQRFLE